MRTALLVIDAQRAYTDDDGSLHCVDAKVTVDKINHLITRCGELDIPIFMIRHVHKADGTDLGRMYDYSGEAPADFDFKEGSDEVAFAETLRRPAKSVEIVKTRYSAFVGTGLTDKLRRSNVDTVIVCGFMTNFCCDSTARDAHDLDFFVDFIVDATGTPGIGTMEQDDIRRIVAEFLGGGYARIYSTEEYLVRLQEVTPVEQ